MFFLDQAAHNFQSKLRRFEKSRANEDWKRSEYFVVKTRYLVQKEINKELWASIFLSCGVNLMQALRKDQKTF